MNFQYFAKQVLFNNSPQKEDGGGTPILVKIARIGITVGIAVMLISVSVVTGFQHAIRDKVAGFGSHITIANYDNNESLEPVPIPGRPPYLNQLKSLPGVEHVQQIATKAGILRVNDEIEGIVVKGIGADFDWSFFQKNLVEGAIFPTSDTAKSRNLIVSKDLCDRLNLKVGDPVQVFFIQKNDRLVRKFNITGVYKTGFSDFDRVYVLADIAHIRRLNEWTSDQTGVLEVKVKDFEQMAPLADQMEEIIGFDQKASTILEQKPWIFDWLNLLDMNAIIIIVLMLIVSAINMVSAMLTLILEKTQVIGILKTLGMDNNSLKKIFALGGLKIASWGFVWGNILGIGLLVFQYFTHAVQLDETNYYVSYVPVNLDFRNFLLVNLISLIMLAISIYLPLFILYSVSPLKAIRYK
jgi:lipoprotein-releasing system permease protein